MASSRRRFIGTSAALTATTAGAVTAFHSRSSTAQTDVQPLQIGIASVPSPEVIALNRMAYGPRPGDINRVRSMGLDNYIEEQLNPDAISDSDCDARLSAARIRVSYDDINELRPLNLLDQSVPELWERRSMTFRERQQAFYQVRTAAWIRAVYSQRQLQEVMVEFWHNHFNVNGPSSSEIASTFPAYDRMMRTHCFGNFRTFLEEVGKSAAMMFYLNNVTNKAGGGEGGNENYARELFELHTLGADNYLKFYDDRRNIGTVEYNGKTFVRGYIDEDVYEASRCLTGWTIANGRRDFGDDVPNNGTFYYYANWHDTNPKTVLSADGVPNILRNQPALKDGQDVFDLLAGHPGTAQYICTKLCRRFIADNPPSSVVSAAVSTWMEHINSPDQIRRVVRVILQSNAFKTTWGKKIKRPFETVVSYLRATNADLQNDTLENTRWDRVNWNVGNTGHWIFEYPAPTGYPDTMDYWVSTNGMLRRWNLPYILTQSWGGGVEIDLVGQTDMNKSCTEIVDGWIARLFGYEISPSVRQALIEFMAQGGDVNEAPQPTEREPDWGKPEALEDRLRSMVQLLASSPEFQTR